MTDDIPADQAVGQLRLPDDLGSPRLLVELAEAVHAALRAAQQGWVAKLEDGPGEAESPVTYEDPSDSRVAAQVAATAVVEHLKAVEFARPAKLPAELVGKVLAGLRYKPGWSFEPAVLPDGTVAVRVVADLEDHLHPGRTFRTSRAAPLQLSKPGQSPGEVVTEAALRAVLSIEEHEIREQLVLDSRRSQPLDPHTLPTPPTPLRRSGANPRRRNVRQDGGVTNPFTFEGLTEPRQWLRLAEDRAHQGRYEDALRAHEFYHRHALEVEDSQYGVRLSFALAAWARLAGLYPPALEALQTLRRQAAAAAVDAGDVERFSEALSVDQWLNDDDASYALIGAVEAAFSDTVADFTEHRVLRILIERGEYERALRWIGDPWQSYAMELELYGLPNSGIPDHEEWRRRSFVEGVRRLVVILVGANRPGDAEAMAARASDVIDDPQLLSALDDAHRVVAARPAS